MAQVPFRHSSFLSWPWARPYQSSPSLFVLLEYPDRVTMSPHLCLTSLILREFRGAGLPRQTVQSMLLWFAGALGPDLKPPRSWEALLWRLRLGHWASRGAMHGPEGPAHRAGLSPGLNLRARLSCRTLVFTLSCQLCAERKFWGRLGG